MPNISDTNLIEMYQQLEKTCLWKLQKLQALKEQKCGSASSVPDVHYFQNCLWNIGVRF